MNFLITSLGYFLAECSPSKRRLEKRLAILKSAKEMASFLIVENAPLGTTYPDVYKAYMMHIAVPVTVATTERSFSKLKLFQNFLRSFMSRERLSGLVMLLIKNIRAKNLDFRKVIQQYASEKARQKNFKFPTTRK